MRTTDVSFCEGRLAQSLLICLGVLEGQQGHSPMRALLTVFIFFLVCLSTAPAWALRCGNRLVSRGEAQTAVLYKCGEPDTSERRVIYRALPQSDAFGVLQSFTYVPVVV